MILRLSIPQTSTTLTITLKLLGGCVILECLIKLNFVLLGKKWQTPDMIIANLCGKVDDCFIFDSKHEFFFP